MGSSQYWAMKGRPTMTEIAIQFLLIYDVVDDYVAKREPFRSAHLAHARQAHERGELLLAGALTNPVDGAVLAFAGHSREAVEAFAKTDPYVVNGLVTAWRIREWSTIVW
jgi:uncharacterized protein